MSFSLDDMPMRRRQGVSKGGLIEIQGPGEGPEDVRYIPTFTCCHCGNIKTVPANAAEMGFCQSCHARECVKCARKGRCTPFEKKIAEYEQRMRLRAAIAAG